MKILIKKTVTFIVDVLQAYFPTLILISMIITLSNENQVFFAAGRYLIKGNTLGFISGMESLNYLENIFSILSICLAMAFFNTFIKYHTKNKKGEDNPSMVFTNYCVVSFIGYKLIEFYLDKYISFGQSLNILFLIIWISPVIRRIYLKKRKRDDFLDFIINRKYILEILDEKDEEIGSFVLFIRYFINYCLLYLFPLSYILPVLRRDNRGLADLILKTKVEIIKE